VDILSVLFSRKKQEWHEASQDRESKIQSGYKPPVKRNTYLVIVSYLLISASIWGVLAIYWPVARTEMYFQIQDYRNSRGTTGGDWLTWLVPRFTFDLSSGSSSDRPTDFTLVIPKIYVKESVIANVDPTRKDNYLPALQKGIAHAAGTAMPGDGQLGYYFAHSSGMNILAPQKQAIFYLLGKLKEGDEVYLFREGKKYTFEVSGKQVLEADNVTFLNTLYDKETIVMQTCWPIGTSLRRLIVTAQLTKVS